MNFAVPVDPTSTALPLWAAVALSYLLGATPVGFLLAKHLRGIDLREVGSGNIGATNTIRAIGRPWGLFAFALDFGKGWVPVFVIASAAATSEGLGMAQLACGTAAVLGHCFPVYLRFKGGKGVATGCGAVVAVDPLVFVFGGLVWLATLAVSRFVGLASILMGASFPVIAWWRHPDERPFVAGCTLLFLLILIRHRQNISRMLAGTEPKMGQKKPEPSNG